MRRLLLSSLCTLFTLGAPLVLSSCCLISGGPCPAPEAESLVTGLRLTSDSGSVRLAPTASSAITLSLTSSDTAAHALQLLPVSGDVAATLSTTALSPGRTAQLQITAGASAPPTQRIQLQVVASLRNAADTLAVFVEVVAPFTLGVSGAFIADAGAVVAATATLQRAPGFVAPVALALSGFPTTWTVTPPTTPSSASSVPFSVAIPSGTAPGMYLGELSATFVATTQRVTLPLEVRTALPAPDITLAALPDSIVAEQGATAGARISITRNIFFPGAVALSVSGLPAGTTASFAPPAATDTSRLSVVVGSATPPGRTTLTVTGVIGAITRQLAVPLIVTSPPPPPTLSLTLTPPAITIARGATGTISAATATTGAAGAVAVSLLNLPAGVTATVAGAASPRTVTLAVGATVAPGLYPITVRATAGALVVDATVNLTVPVPPPVSDFTLQVPAAPVTVGVGGTQLVPVRVVRTGGFAGVQIQIAATSFPGAGGNAWIAPSRITGDTAVLQIIGGTAGTYPVNITAAGGAFVRTATVTVTVEPSTAGDFALIPQSFELVLPRGQFKPLGIDIRRSNGHSSTVTLSALRPDVNNWAINITPSTATPTSATSVIANFYASPNVVPGVYVVALRGTAGGVERGALVTIFVQ